MKLATFIFTLIIFTQTSEAQIFKYKTTSVSMAKKDIITGEWGRFSKPEATEVLVVFNIPEKRFSVYSAVEQNYDIIESYDKRIDSDGDIIYDWTCIDDKGIKGIVRIIKLNSIEGTDEQIYFYFGNYAFLYTMNYL